MPESGCSSTVGCSHYKKERETIHELLLVLGSLHMHTAIERDKFVKVNYGNIPPNALGKL
ncbi:CLUMA_CG010426, isoform A [Clunio marinus]|uniref:CLUMA_CG010426, isoform A n=1 Tax=Clunio marinus TaxID=568069 RepID=A0A1J1I9T9_9DIPT|nr:CLUMA_CG010426, isoform A [Clunio marinus]